MTTRGEQGDMVDGQRLDAQRIVVIRLLVSLQAWMNVEGIGRVHPCDERLRNGVGDLLVDPPRTATAELNMCIGERGGGI